MKNLLLSLFCVLSSVSFLKTLSAEPTTLRSESSCNVLCFSGGGSFGAVEVGILDKIKLPIGYDLITGISAGGLNAGFLSYFHSLDKTNPHLFADGITNLKNIYAGLTNDDVYDRHLAQVSRSWSYYDTVPLHKTIDSKLAPLAYKGQPKPVLIGSTNLNMGALQIFRFDEESKLRQSQIMMATSAIPLVFPPQVIDGSHYVDGGAIANEILNGIESFLPTCTDFNITFISASGKLDPVAASEIDTLEEYVRRLANVVMTDFNNELAEISGMPDCSSKGVIHYCYPVGDYLSEYSSMDFSYGKELYDIGYNHFTCETLKYC